MLYQPTCVRFGTVNDGYAVALLGAPPEAVTGGGARPTAVAGRVQPAPLPRSATQPALSPEGLGLASSSAFEATFRRPTGRIYLPGVTHASINTLGACTQPLGSSTAYQAFRYRGTCHPRLR